MSSKFVEKKHRLPLKLYRGYIRAHFTICIKGNHNFFTNNQVIDPFLEILKDSLKKNQCLNWVYVFMPDHIHILIEGKEEESDLWRAVVDFKQRSGYFMSSRGLGVRWQKDFYDHVLRKDEDILKHLRYIVDNPVRAGLVRSWKDYPFTSSLDFNLSDLLVIR